MKKVIHHIRKQPDYVKSRYVIVFALIATAFIVSIWVATLRMIDRNDDTIRAESPFKMVTGLFSNALNETKKNYQEQKTQILSNTATHQDAVTNVQDSSVLSNTIIENSLETSISPIEVGQ